MKNILFFFLAVASFNIFGSCAQNRQLVEQPPFKITSSYYTSWIAEKPENASGMDVFLTITNKPDDVVLQKLFFKGQSAPVKAQGETYSAHFQSKKVKKDYTISADRSEEVNNPKPQIPVKAPEKIDIDEALLVYTQAGKEFYYKLKKLQDKGTKFPAEAPFNNNQ